jgi:hypothetical protein
MESVDVACGRGPTRGCLLRRHLHGRLVSSAGVQQQQHAASDSATSLRWTARGEKQRAESPLGTDAVTPGGAAVLSNGLSLAVQPAEAAATGREGLSEGGREAAVHGTACGMAQQNGAAACNGSSESEAAHSPRESEGGSSGNAHALQRVKYFRSKRAAWLTGWWESVAAFGAVLLLPLVSIVPCSTTAVRDDRQRVSAGDA